MSFFICYNSESKHLKVAMHIKVAVLRPPSNAAKRDAGLCKTFVRKRSNFYFVGTGLSKNPVRLPFVCRKLKGRKNGTRGNKGGTCHLPSYVPPLEGRGRERERGLQI